MSVPLTDVLINVSEGDQIFLQKNEVGKETIRGGISTWMTVKVAE